MEFNSQTVARVKSTRRIGVDFKTEFTRVSNDEKIKFAAYDL